MVVVALFGGTAHPAKKFFCSIRASADLAISLFVIDALHCPFA